ncbi:MAG: hypothetical protein PVS3B1_30060 [Ktedonobacteraceae bacterium]
MRDKAETSNKKERVQLDFTLEALARLDTLKEEIGASTRAETIRQALRLFSWFVSESMPDDTITITDKKGETISRFKANLIHEPRSSGNSSTRDTQEPGAASD